MSSQAKNEVIGIHIHSEASERALVIGKKKAMVKGWQTNLIPFSAPMAVV